jgi:bifunctional NMN adenylyltransferase/nudix hydrolase
MQKKQYDAIILIGRFQPFHNAHLKILNRANELTNKIIVVIGSSNQPRTYKNPFSSKERQSMIEAESGAYIVFCEDNAYNDQAWAVNVQKLVWDSLWDKSTVDMYEQGKAPTINDFKIGIIGHKKDESSFYLDMFPNWELIEIPLIESLDATTIRDLYFRENHNLNFLTNVVPEKTKEFLRAFAETEEFAQIVRERKFIEEYKKQFSGLAYPPTFVTTDAVVIQSGHVLMIRRRSEPGKGLWALPGGFLNAASDRSLVDACIRELKEETGIKVPVPVLKGNIQDSRVFDAINRSARGRTITHAYKIVLPNGELPKVKGLDDADKARWIPISQILRNECFEDHYDIINWAIGG